MKVTKTIPFNWERYNADKKKYKVITRSGDEVTQLISFDEVDTDFALTGVLKNSVKSWRLDGFYHSDGETINPIDLVSLEWEEDIVESTSGLTIDENTSDGYHTFKELYEFRKAFNVALFNEWGANLNKNYNVHKSWRHHDGELCFGGGWFIVVAVLPTGQISNHYKAEDWDLFRIPEHEKAMFLFDGHTGKDVIQRLLSL